MAWKAVHFGQLLPNPFYVKAAGHHFISSKGVRGVRSFLESRALLIALLCPCILLTYATHDAKREYNKTALAVGIAFIVVNMCFFVRTDTLMDIHGRFLYPLVPIVIFLAIPALKRMLEFIDSTTRERPLLLIVALTGFLLAFGPSYILGVHRNLKHLVPNDGWRSDNSLEQKEFRIVQNFAVFPDILKVRIAFGDSGVIPYFTDALWLDVVGLNDGFIARTRDKRQLVDYFFQWKPDLVIHPGSQGQSWIQYGHGPLGDYLSWANDPRWDDYEYIGTCLTDGPIYDLQFFVRKSSPLFASLSSFLKTSVVDGWYDSFPIPIGTYVPNNRVEATFCPPQAK